jgi:hypothetical protein
LVNAAAAVCFTAFRMPLQTMLCGAWCDCLLLRRLATVILVIAICT